MPSQATDAQKDAVKKMVDAMMHPTMPPKDGSFTLGWDVVASYSEDQINSLLAERFGKQNNDMFKEMAFTGQGYNEETEEHFPIHYRMTFGPPLLQFNARATGQPMCSITMKIKSGTKQIRTGAIKDIAQGWSVRLNNIPLGTARGKLTDGGKIEGSPEILPGHRPVQFNYDEKDHQNVVLAFSMDKSSVTVQSIPPPGTNLQLVEHVTTQEQFQKVFKSQFVGPDVDPSEGVSKLSEEEKALRQPRALSYSIATVNNDVDDDAKELAPDRFQFATFASSSGPEDVRVLSVFIQCKGRPAGQTEKLQSAWDTQWDKNDIRPIPKGFTASLILSSSLVKNVFLKKGFEAKRWTIEDKADPKAPAPEIKIACKSPDTFDVAEQNHKYGATSNFHVDGFSIPLCDWPLTITIKQDAPDKQPSVYGYWKIEKKIPWKATWKIMGVPGSESGTLNGLYTLCDVDNNKHHLPRKMEETTVTVNDESLKLELKLKNKENFRFDQDSPNKIDFDTWEKGMKGLWSEEPKVSIGSIGIGFLRTTNLLMPGQRVISINDSIGLRAPKDFLLVGDVLKN